VITIHQRHRQTDGRTDRQTDDMRSHYRALHQSASRGKNAQNSISAVALRCASDPLGELAALRRPLAVFNVPGRGRRRRGGMEREKGVKYGEGKDWKGRRE